MSKVKYIFLLTLYFCMFGCMSEEWLITGFVYEMSENQLVLEQRHTESYVSLMFQCETDVCKSVGRVNVGDEVILALDRKNNENKLLSIGKCVTDDEQCLEVKNLDVKEFEEVAQAIKASEQCQLRMNEALRSRSLYFADDPKKSDNSNKIIDQFNSIYEQSKYKKCISDFLSAYKNAVFEVCQEQRCGEKIGGGCYHKVNFSVTTPVIKAAIEQCSI